MRALFDRALFCKGEKMRKEEFTFDSRDGKSKIHAYRYIPEQEPFCILQIIPGMNDHMGRYEKLAQFLTERGVLVVGEDHLGHGKTVTEGDTFGYFCENDAATVVLRDVHRMKKLTQEQYPTLPYFILGHSMGSFILRNYLGKYGTGISGAVICATGTPTPVELRFGKILTSAIAMVKGWKYVSKLVHHISTKAYMSGIENARTEHDWLSTDESVIDVYMQDRLSTGFKFTVNGYHTMYELALRMQKKEIMQKIPKKLPILIVSGTEDPVGNKSAAPKKLYDDYLNLDLTKVVLKLYSDTRHEVLHGVISDTVYVDLYNWMEKAAMES